MGQRHREWLNTAVTNDAKDNNDSIWAIYYWKMY